MKKIQILGTGCPKCKRLLANTEDALKSADFMQFGVMTTPALVIDGSVGGAVLGSYLMTDKLNKSQVKLIIGVILLAIAAKMIWKLIV